MHQKRSDPLPVIVQAYLRVYVWAGEKHSAGEKKEVKLQDFNAEQPVWRQSDYTSQTALAVKNDLIRVRRLLFVQNRGRH